MTRYPGELVQSFHKSLTAKAECFFKFGRVSGKVLGKAVTATSQKPPGRVMEAASLSTNNNTAESSW